MMIFLFHQGPTKGLGKIRFHDYNLAYDTCDLPNVEIFKSQIKSLKMLVMLGKPSKEQIKDIDFLLILGELFCLVAYGQLILENRKLRNISDDLIDQIFDFMIRDFSKYALQLYSKPSATFLQRMFSKRIIKRPVPNEKRFEKVLKSMCTPIKMHTI